MPTAGTDTALWQHHQPDRSGAGTDIRPPLAGRRRHFELEFSGSESEQALTSHATSCSGHDQLCGRPPEAVASYEPAFGRKIDSHIRCQYTELGCTRCAMVLRVRSGRVACLAENRSRELRRLNLPMIADLLDSPPRSWLFVPGTRVTELLAKAAASGADALIVDLEDAVAPDEKTAARSQVLDATAAFRPMVPWFVRMNATPAALLEADASAAVQAQADGVVLPKVSGPEDVQRVSETMARLEALHGRQPLAIVALIESARGILAAERIAAADQRLIGMAFGGEDFALDIGTPRTRGGVELLHARGRLVLAAAAAGKWAIDTPCTDIGSPSRAGREAGLARRLGFVGKMVIHPSHVKPVNDAFTPSEREVAAARAVVDAFETAKAMGLGVVRVGGRMVDEPVAAAARRVIARARLR